MLPVMYGGQRASMFILGNASKAAMIGLHPKLVTVVKRAIQLSAIDWSVHEGVRSMEQCYINWGQGRTKQDCARHGVPAKYAKPNAPKVTWLSDPLASNHAIQRDGYGHAVDLYPYPVSLWWNKPASFFEPLFDKIAKAMFAAAKEQGVKIRWGANWDMDAMPRERGETDNPHFELA